METIKIPFSGINRSIDEGISNDGQCMELINARIKNGSVEPIGNPILLSRISIGAVSKMYFHSITKRYIAITENGKSYSLNEDFTISEQLSSDLDGTIENIEFVGKTACVITKSGTKHLLFTNGKYKYLGEKPSYTFQVWADEELDIEITNKKFECQYTKSTSGDIVIDYRDINPFIDFLGACKNEALAPHMSKARIAEPVCIRTALRMYDGSYICHSPIYLICPISNLRNSFEEISASYISPGGGEKGKIEIVKFLLHSYLIKYSYEINDLENWRDLIISLDIFVSRPFGVIDAETCISSGVTISNSSKQIIIYTYNREKMLDEIMSSSSQLYFSKSLTNNQPSEGTIDVVGDTNSQILSDDAYSHNSLSPQTSYVYNNRLHIGNIKSTLFNGFLTEFRNDYKFYYNGCPLNKKFADLKIFTHISTDEGEKIVFNHKGIVHPLNPLLCYPDNRATEMHIYAALPSENGTIIYRRMTASLTKSRSINMSYYLGFDTGRNRGIWPIDLMEHGSEITEEEYNSPNITVNNIEQSHNKLKVSSLNNPFVFPASQTYQLSSEEIIGICANTNALSQGQFGQHPLYVFSKDGIYAMSVGTGSVVYSNQVPVSRDTCTDKRTIKGIDQAVIFASKRGLMMISGNSVQLLSADLDGYLPSCIDLSPIIPKIAKVASMESALSRVTFNEYIKGAEIGYNYQESELLVSNKNYTYAYIFNMTSSSWTKLYPNPSTFVNKYPDCFAIMGNAIYDMQNNHRSISKILLLTKPIKMGNNSHKRILQTALRGIVKRAMSDLYLRGEPVMFRGDNLNVFSDIGLYILGSNDAEHFSLISGKESIVDIRDLISKMNKSKPYKYFMVALVGGVRTDVSLNYMEFIASQAYANRLR